MHEPIPRRRGLPNPLAWLFIALSIGDIAWYTISARFDANPAISDIVAYVIQVVPSVCTFLLPAALLIRHPDAPSRARTLLFGTILLALAQVLSILATPLEPFFETVTPPTQDLPLVWLSVLYGDLTSLVITFGLLYMAVGLSQARRYEDRSGPLIGLFVPVLAVVAAAVEIVAVARLDLGGLTVSTWIAIYLASTVVFGVIRIVVWAYLTATTARGVQAGEDPIVGWRLAVLGGLAVIVALALVNIGGLFEITNDTFNSLYGYLTIIFYALGYLLLLAGFAFGLPTLDDLEDGDRDEDEDDEDFDEEDDDDEDGDDDDR